MNKKDAIERINELSKELEKHNHSYYVLDNPSISDYEYDMMYAELTAFVDGQVVILYDRNAIEPFRSLSDYLDSFFIREESPLVYIDSHCHNHFIKHGKSPLQNIEMACSKRIE